MEEIDKEHEVTGFTITVGWRKKSRNLISPRGIKRELCEGHEFNMSEFHLVNICNQLNGKLLI